MASTLSLDVVFRGRRVLISSPWGLGASGDTGEKGEMSTPWQRRLGFSIVKLGPGQCQNLETEVSSQVKGGEAAETGL